MTKEDLYQKLFAVGVSVDFETDNEGQLFFYIDRDEPIGVEDKIKAIITDMSFEHTDDGDIVVYTNLCENEDGELVEFIP